MSDIDIDRTWEEIQEDVFKDIDVGIATLRMEGPSVFTFIKDSSDTENGLIAALHYIFVDPDSLILHDAFRRLKWDGEELTPEAVLQIATSKVAYYTRDAVVKDWLGDDAEVEFDDQSKKYILGSLYMRSLITHLASESKKEFDKIERAFQAQTNTDNYVALRL
jgi:hypothetical protein